MSNHIPKDENGKIDWEELAKFFDSDGGDDRDSDHPTKAKLSDDEQERFDKMVEPLLLRIFNYCKDNKIPFIASFSILANKEKDEEKEPRMGTRLRSIVAIPMDTEHTICELMACNMILTLPHEFSHMILGMGSTWMAMGARRDGDMIDDLEDRLDGGLDDGGDYDDTEDDE